MNRISLVDNFLKIKVFRELISNKTGQLMVKTSLNLMSEWIIRRTALYNLLSGV